jgi:hypothetical protein
MSVIESPIQKAIVDFLKEKGVSQRKFADMTGASESIFNKYSAMTSAMGVDMLDKILSAYPGAKQALIDYLGGRTTEEIEGLFYKNLVESRTEYRLMHKKVLDEYDMIPKTETHERREIIQILKASMQEAKDALIEKHEVIIAGYKMDIAKLEQQVKDLRGRIPPDNK